MSIKKMNSRNPKVDDFLSKAQKWREEYEKLGTIILDCQLKEELKWIQRILCSSVFQRSLD